MSFCVAAAVCAAAALLAAALCQLALSTVIVSAVSFWGASVSLPLSLMSLWGASASGEVLRRLKGVSGEPLLENL